MSTTEEILALLEQGELPVAVETELWNVMSGAEPGPALQQYLAQHPQFTHEVQELQQSAVLLCEDRNQREPGDAFFEALHRDIMQGLDTAHEQEEVAVLEGSVASTKAPVQAQEASWWTRLRALFSAHPTLGYASLMAAGLALLVLWPSSPQPRVPSHHLTITPELAGVAPGTLSADELQHLKELSSSMNIEIDLGGDEYAAWDEDDDETWGAGVGNDLHQLSLEELEALDAKLLQQGG